MRMIKETQSVLYHKYFFENIAPRKNNVCTGEHRFLSRRKVKLTSYWDRRKKLVLLRKRIAIHQIEK